MSKSFTKTKAPSAAVELGESDLAGVRSGTDRLRAPTRDPREDPTTVSDDVYVEGRIVT